MEGLSQDCEIPVEEVKDIASLVTNQCKLVKVVEGKRQSIKIQNIFVNSSWVEKIVKFNYY